MSTVRVPYVQREQVAQAVAGGIAHLHGLLKSKSFAGSTGLSDYQAMYFVLSIAWHEHTAAPCQQCPWTFGGWRTGAPMVEENCLGDLSGSFDRRHRSCIGSESDRA